MARRKATTFTFQAVSGCRGQAETWLRALMTSIEQARVKRQQIQPLVADFHLGGKASPVFAAAEHQGKAALPHQPDPMAGDRRGRYAPEAVVTHTASSALSDTP
jgi:hypothetical protein